MPTLRLLFVTALMCGLAACAPQVVVPTPTQLPISNTLAASATQPIATATPIVALSPTPNDTATPAPPRVTATRQPTRTPRPSATATPAPRLANREPQETEVLQFLGFDSEWNIKLFYQDVNNDQSNDLIVRLAYDGGPDEFIPPYLSVLLWSNNAYIEVLRVEGDTPLNNTFNSRDSQVAFEDWTGDNQPEVVFDTTTSVGGANEFVFIKYRVIVHCTMTKCQEVWRKTTSEFSDDFFAGGMYSCETLIRRTTDTQGRPAISYINAAFLFHSFGSWVDCDLPQDAISETFSNLLLEETGVAQLLVFPKYKSIYSWTGKVFELTDQKQYAKPYASQGWEKLDATGSSGVRASIAVEYGRFNYDDYSATTQYNNDTCQVTIAGQPTGQPFGCKWRFTQVEWKDITGDGREEVVVATTSGFYSQNSCVHQRLLAFQWDGTTATEIANVEGCVVQENLYGVRLEDVDGDGVPEILAAEKAADNFGNLGTNRIYKWNGTTFAFVEERPGK